MKNKEFIPKFGILSGAGPMAGALLYQKVVKLSQEKGAWRDADFPFIILKNMPFSEMLDGNFSNSDVRNELLASLSFLAEHTDYIYIACQTLHAFLTSEEITAFRIVSLLSLAKQAFLKEKNDVQVVASKTSRLFDLHGKGLERACRYINHQQSEEAINIILRGGNLDLKWLENLAYQNPILLGCTEFSVALCNTKAPFVDPIQLAAEDMVEKFFSHKLL